MRKFTIRSVKDVTTIYELDVVTITGVEDPSVMWLNPGEYKVRVLKPESFHMKVEKKDAEGKRVTVLEPDVWCWHSVYDDYYQALSFAVKIIESDFEFKKRKYGKDYTNADVAAAMWDIKLEKLPGSDFQTDVEKLNSLQNALRAGEISTEEALQSLKNLKS